MKVVVDYSRCESNALCVRAAPGVFEVRADDKLYLLQEHPPQSSRAAVERAVRVCPRQAIAIIEE